MRSWHERLEKMQFGYSQCAKAQPSEALHYLLTAVLEDSISFRVRICFANR